MAVVKVRLFAALRDVAGASEVDGEGSTAGEVVDRLAERFGERFAVIARAGSVVVAGERADRDRGLSDGDEVAILPPVSGGAASAPSSDALSAVGAQRPGIIR